jgi:N-acyl-D-aspartate/D-glutamate deacylase
MHDLIIRNGTVVDGTGGARRIADVAVDDGLVTAVGSAGRGKREIEADGLLVLPGWVDIHTHYDGQVTWDPDLTPSSWHGVTTTVFGNCGVGFAPVRPKSESYLINLMEGVEDIPGTVLAEGVPFDWETFPQYLDALERGRYAMDIGAQVPHSALRFYVMGERGADHAVVPSPAEVDRMGRSLEEALAAGALGFTTSRTAKHLTADGRPVPSRSAGKPELLGLAAAMARAGTGVLECNSDLVPGDFEVLCEVASVARRPLSLLLLQENGVPGRWRETLDGIHAANRRGVRVVGQVGCRSISVLMGLETSLQPFGTHPAWTALASLAPRERYRRLVADERLRRRLIEERPDDAHTRDMAVALERCYVLGDPPDYEPHPSETIASRARRAGCSPWELALDAMMAVDGRGLLLYPFENYHEGSLDIIRVMLADEHTVCGIGDGGAHVATVCDASYPTFLTSYWSRDRTRGAQLPLEGLVAKQTSRTARSYGLLDRGVLAPGYKADINVIEFDRLRVRRPELVYDFPAGGKRFIQRASGYRHTFVAGVEVQRDGELTGERPGRLLRGEQPAPALRRVR